MNFIVYDLQGNRIRNLNGKASHHYVFSGLDTTTISAVESEVKKGYCLLYQDDRSKWHEFIVSSITTAHTKGGITHEIYAENSLISLRGESPIMDRRNISSPSKAMEIITAGTPWNWECDLSATGNLSFYHISPFDALSETLKIFGGEFYTKIRVEGNQITRTIVLTDRVGEDHGKRFSYRKDMASIKRKVKEEDVVTRLYPYGKGESVGDGYGRRISISSVNGGKDYIENTAAQSRYGYKGSPFSAIKIYDSIEDAAKLKKEAEKDLLVMSEPNIEYEATVVDLKSYGMDFEGTSIGDTVRIRDKDLDLSLIGRVMELEVDPDGEEETKIKLGNIRENLDNRLSGMEKTLARISLKEGALDSLVNHESFINLVVQGLNDAFKTSTNYMRFSPEEGMIFTDNPDESKAKWAMNLGSLGFRIANKKKPNGEWDFRTFGTGSGFTADLIRTGMLQGGKVKWNMETGYLNIGDKLIYDPASGELHLAQGSVTINSLDEETKGKINQAIELSGAITDTATEYAMGGCGNAAPMDGWSEDALLTMADKNEGVNLPYNGDVALITMRQEKMRAIKKDGSFSDSSFSLSELLPDRFYVYVDQLPATLSGFESSIPTYYTGSSSPVETLKRFYIDHYTDGGFQKLFKTGCLWKRTLYKCSDGTVKYSPAERVGKDGKRAYVHIAYADDNKGGGFSFDDSDKAYMGQYTDQEEETSTDATRYKWTRIRGKDGTDGNNGTNGRGVKTVITQYAVVYSDETPSGSSWTDTPPSYWSEYAKVWQRLKITYTDGSIGYTTPEKFEDAALKSLKEKMNTIESGYTEIKDGQARFVTKSALGAVGETSINGFNITTGGIRSQTGDTYIDLNGSNFTFGRGAMTYSPSDGLRIGGSRYYMTSDNRCFAIHSTEWRNGRLGGFRATTDDQDRTNGVMLYASHGFNFRISTQPDQADNTYKHHIVLYNGSGGSAWTELQQDTIVRTKLYAVNAGMIQATELRSSSDIRLKKDIKPWDVKALDVINATDFIRFRWKEGDDEAEHYGVSAQSIPMAQVKRKDGYLAVDGYTMSAINGKALQELNHKVEQLEEQNKGLQMRIKRLEEAIHDIIGRS